MRDRRWDRRVDVLGRIVIPIDIRQSLGITDGTRMEFDYDSDAPFVTLRLARETCRLCGGTEDLLEIGPRGYALCMHCRRTVAEIGA